MTGQLRIIIYARLSKNRNGLSTNTKIQVAECLEEARYYAKTRGLELVLAADPFEEDDVSASRYSKKPRPKYDMVLNLIRANKVDMIWSTEQERLHRRPREMDELIDLAETTALKEIYFTSDGEGFNLETPNGIFRARSAVNAAERESRKISERTKRKEADRAKNGLPHGGHRTFGYTADGRSLVEVETAVLDDMAGKTVIGWSYLEISEWLNREGHKTAQGKEWFPITVRNTLRRKRYAGIREHLGVEYPATWPAVFDADTWEELQYVIRTRSEKGSGSAGRGRYMLTGLLYCGACGDRLNGEPKRDKPHRPLRKVYVCRGCRGINRNAGALEHFIREVITYRLDSPELASLLDKDEKKDRQLKELVAERQMKTRRLTGLLDDYTDGTLSKTDYLRARTRVEAALADVERELDQLQRSRLNLALSAGESVKDAWMKQSDGWRRQVISLLTERIVVLPGKTKPFYDCDGVTMRFDPSLVEIDWKV
jgi:site-specific DNA recombinase